MRVRPIVERVKGFYRVADYARRWGMIALDAQRRLPVQYVLARYTDLTAAKGSMTMLRRTIPPWSGRAFCPAS